MLDPGLKPQQCLYVSTCMKQLSCQAASRCHTRDEYQGTCTPLPSMNKTAYPGFGTQRRRHQKSKIAVSVAPQKGLMSSRKFKKHHTSPCICRTIVTSSLSMIGLRRRGGYGLSYSSTPCISLQDNSQIKSQQDWIQEAGRLQAELQ